MPRARFEPATLGTKRPLGSANPWHYHSRFDTVFVLSLARFHCFCFTFWRHQVATTDKTSCLRFPGSLFEIFGRVSGCVYVVHVDGVKRCQNCGHQRAYCSFPRLYMSMESHGGMIPAGENRRTWRKTCAWTVCPPQIPHGLTRARKLKLISAANCLSHGIVKCRVSPLKPKLVYMIFKNSVRTSKRT
jgi:hypothetical protein